AAAAGFAGVVTLGALRAPLGTFGSPTAGAAAVLHDTLPAGLAGDSVASALLRDTVRLVRFVLVAPTAARLALVGDFNAWSRDSTPMRVVAESTGTWTATLALAPGEYEYAYVVDDTGWTVDPRAPRAAGEGRARSVLVVPEVGR
ncbi:MAG TPA: isoamylase early set domain-containing protein, partial [Gemmatimonadales bacterium]